MHSGLNGKTETKSFKALAFSGEALVAELIGAVRLYRAASSERREGG